MDEHALSIMHAFSFPNTHTHAVTKEGRLFTWFQSQTFLLNNTWMHKYALTYPHLHVCTHTYTQRTFPFFIYMLTLPQNSLYLC